MKALLCTSLSALLLISCNSDDKAKVEGASTDSANMEVALPAKLRYEGKVEIGKTENVATVMNWNKEVVARNWEKVASYMADSVTASLADGMEFTLPRDSALSILRSWVTSMDSMSQDYFTAVALDNENMNDEWVVQWVTETYYKGGKSEQKALSESYLIKNGKIRRISQYERAVPQKK